jgi:hypothetical protein
MLFGDKKMFEVFKKSEETETINEPQTNQPTVPEISNTPPSVSPPSLPTLLETLEGEERTLLIEKAELINIQEELTQKMQDEIEARKRNIEILKSEIPMLKKKCETLANTLGIEVKKS